MGIREDWPQLSARERDAKVAEALGWTVVDLSSGAHRQIDCTDPLGRPSTSLHFVDGDLHYEATTVHADGLPYYSTSWEHAGQLLDRLADEGWFPSLEARYDRGRDEVRWYLAGCSQEGLCLPQGEGYSAAPEAIAFGFGLARLSDENNRTSPSPRPQIVDLAGGIPEPMGEDELAIPTTAPATCAPQPIAGLPASWTSRTNVPAPEAWMVCYHKGSYSWCMAPDRPEYAVLHGWVYMQGGLSHDVAVVVILALTTDMTDPHAPEEGEPAALIRLRVLAGAHEKVT